MSDLLTICSLYNIWKDWTIYSIRNNKYIKVRLNKHTWYLQVWISINSIRKTYDIHRLVAEAFIPNPENKLTVNHKNWIKTDNRVENLEWATSKEQTQHAINSLWIKIWSGDRSWDKNWKARKTAQYDVNWNLIKIWDFAKQASSIINISPSMITACCRWERKTWWWYIRNYL